MKTGSDTDWNGTTGIKPYKFMDDMTFAGVPIFVAGIIAKSEKASFRQNYDSKSSRARLVTNFHNEIDNYTQYVPFALAAGLNFAGVEAVVTIGVSSPAVPCRMPSWPPSSTPSSIRPRRCAPTGVRAIHGHRDILPQPL